MKTTVSDYYEYARSIFSEKENPEYAAKQAAYMKYNFEYFGLNNLQNFKNTKFKISKIQKIAAHYCTAIWL